MQRSASRGGLPFSMMGGSGGSSGGGSFFTHKNGTLDRPRVFMVLFCVCLGLWTFYDLCCHFHHQSFEEAVQTVKENMKHGAGDARPIEDGILRAPGSAEGKLPESSMFRNLDSQKNFFLNSAGVLAYPFQAEHVVKKQMNDLHVATILSGQTRGNHLHTKHSEVLVLIHGHFLLRVAMLGKDGTWISEDHIFEIGLPDNPFTSAMSTISSTPISIEILPNVCHALRNLDPTVTAFFASYYVLGMDEKREEPDRQICKAQPKAYLKPTQ